MTNPLVQLTELGQSPWHDNIRRSLLTSGALAKMVKDGDITGLTSNPTIFEQAIAKSTDYDETIEKLARKGLSAEAIFDNLSIEDIRAAADVFAPVFKRTGGADGYVSIEVAPQFALDTQATVQEAKRLWKAVNRPNLMVKIPATKEGVPAIQAALAEGLNINITLIFSLVRYEQVMEAYLAALEQRAAAGKKLGHIASVASFFVSRVDVLVDKRLDERVAREGGGHDDILGGLKGKAAIANAKLAYARFRARFGDERWAKLAARGARLQRPLWASTSTKNPAYPDVYYVEALVGPDTVDTMPPATIVAYKDHGRPEVRIDHGMAEAAQVIEQLEELGIRMDEVTHQLEVEGVKSFAKSFDSLISVVEARREAVLQRDRTQVLAPASQRKLVEAAVADLAKADFAKRLWAKDSTLWKAGDELHQAEIKERLGWLDVMDLMRNRVEEMTSFAAGLKDAGLTHALLCGMGGSSLAPEVLRETFGVRAGYLNLAVLDSTDPEALLVAEARSDPAKTLYIIASKSGGTTEPNAMFKYFWQKVQAVKGEAAGENFIAITDPGTAMERTAEAHHFRMIFRNPPEIGGRYSALSYFGLVPAALMGIDVGELLERARRMAQACGPVIPTEQNIAVRLGAAMAVQARAGRDKLTLIASNKLATFGYWVEQLIAESTGKEGLGIVPIEGERLGAPEVYGKDRLFIHMRLDGRQDAAVANLAGAGHPVITLRLADTYDLGGEFLRWEIATAAAGVVLAIDPFDQPNVQESKDNTVRLLAEHAANGALPDEGGKLEAAAPGFPARLLRHLRSAKRGDYVALTAYFHRTPRREKLLRDLQAAIRDHFHTATTVGYGPRFLHSTGQLHKGGANNGVFVQFTAADAADVAVPGEAYSFGVLKAAQALGDYQALLTHRRRAARVDLGTQIEAGLRAARSAVTEAGAAKKSAKKATAKKTAKKSASRKPAKQRAPAASNGARRSASKNGTRPRRR